MKKISGTGVALVTPFTENLEVDYDALMRILVHTAKGVDFYVVMGTTGESVTCTKEEKAEILDFVKTHNPNQLPIVYGVGGNHTQAVMNEVYRTNLKGITALLSVSPYYNKPSQDGIVQHFTAIADISPVPVILYNVPGRTASNLSGETTIRLSGHLNIAGIKEASGNLEQCMQIKRSVRKDFVLLSGDDMLTLPLYAIGAKGVISVLANAYPQNFRKMKNYFEEGQLGKVAAEQFSLLDVNPLMYEEGNPVGIKYLMSLMGLCTPHVRLPMSPASDRLRKKIDELVKGEKLKKGR